MLWRMCCKMLGSARKMQEQWRREEGARRSRKRRLCTGKRWRARGALQGQSTTYVDAASSSSLDASHREQPLQPPPPNCMAAALEQAAARPWPHLPQPSALAASDSAHHAGDYSPRCVISGHGDGDGHAAAASVQRRRLFHEACTAPTLPFTRAALLCSNTLQSSALRRLPSSGRDDPWLSPRPVLAVAAIRRLPQ
ncbi:hypothetical protein SVAN01_06486 [Stagonosporopsis vannaccii]|nr:hypothetical protein SVAN01_06486 [Stagonosporopsis vannaccii]